MSTSTAADTFECRIGGFMGKSHAAALDGDHLRYESFDDGYRLAAVVIAEPGATLWRRFWATLARLDAWAWSGEYVNRDVLDGTAWSISIEHDGKRIEATGNNAYPPNGDGPEPTREFGRFLSRRRAPTRWPRLSLTLGEGTQAHFSRSSTHSRNSVSAPGESTEITVAGRSRRFARSRGSVALGRGSSSNNSTRWT